MSPRRARTLGLIASFAVFIGCSRPSTPVAVGVALSASFIDAARLALEDVAASGDLPPIDTLFFDEQSARAATALELVDSFLVREGLVGVIGHSVSSSSLATAPVYNTHRIVQIAPTSTAIEYADAGAFSYRMVPGDEEQGRFMARTIDSLFPTGTRVAMLYVNDDYGRGLRSALMQGLDTLRFPLVYQQPHTDEEFSNPPPDRAQRVHATVQSVLSTRPGLVVWLGRPGTFALYLRTLRELGGNIPILGGDALANWRDADDGQGDWDGVRYLDFLDLEHGPELQEFRRRYQERFGRSPGTAEVLTYDAMNLFLAAIRDGARTGDQVRQWLDALDAPGREPYVGISGRIAFDEDGNIARSYVLVPVHAPARTAAP